jgi:hypothetical protein
MTLEELQEKLDTLIKENSLSGEENVNFLISDERYKLTNPKLDVKFLYGITFTFDLFNDY